MYINCLINVYISVSCNVHHISLSQPRVSLRYFVSLHCINCKVYIIMYKAKIAAMYAPLELKNI